MNTALTAVASAGSTRVRQRTRLAHERAAIRLGLALVAWGRRGQARLTHEAVAEARRIQAETNAAHLAHVTDANLRFRGF
ncbi:hypothetical protein ET445_03845 [Agromyces protaetiae]|uniref:Uncharacterized protein n=1 Tax=Agromyces protaetiae TaxID=2509455 RepID=A0A4P6FAD4_9MICO|nr:hypothetical protein [Agromyces protaetiae]QAY72605.1 hypothetical protein ET445_03845 [Agromyces protaetiae]